MQKILIALSTFNRKNITKLCLENLKQIVDKDKKSKLVIYDDASTNYGDEFLKQYSDNVLRFRVSGGVERSRARAFRDFIYIYKDFDLFYMTDNDTIHDPDFLDILRKLYESSSKKFDKKLTIADLETFVSMSAGLTPDNTETNRLVESGLCKLTGEGALVFSPEGINLQRDMKLEAKPMKKIKMTGDDASKLIDQMFSELEQ